MTSADQASAVLYEGVKDVLSAQVSATTVAAGQAVTFTGTVSPDHTGHTIYLERQGAGGDFHVIAVGQVGAGSVYSIGRSLYDPGTKVLRVFVPGGPENQGTPSQPFAVTVTPTAASALPAEPSEGPTFPPKVSPSVLATLAQVAKVPGRAEPAGCSPRPILAPRAPIAAARLALAGARRLAQPDRRVAARAAIARCPNQQRIGPVVAVRTAKALMHQPVSIAVRSIPESAMGQTA